MKYFTVEYACRCQPDCALKKTDSIKNIFFTFVMLSQKYEYKNYSREKISVCDKGMLKLNYLLVFNSSSHFYN